MQLQLLDSSPIKKEIKTIPISDLTISKFNPRISRPDGDITKLAQRISKNGFEITRALWSYQSGNGYEVFAGGTRLEAARRAGCKTVPVVIHEGLTDEDIVRLSDEDNENDEYHTPVSCVDVWLSYKTLADSGWTQERIARAKEVNRAYVSLRLDLAQLPLSVLDKFVRNDFLKESHGLELVKMLESNNLSPWLTREGAMLEIIDLVLKKSPTSPTATQFKEAVTTYNKLIEYVSGCYDSLLEEWREKFIDELRDTRSTDQVQKAYARISEMIVNKKREEERQKLLETQQAQKETLEAEHKAAIESKIRATMDLIICGDVTEAMDSAPDDIAMVLTDPPYGVDFQSNRRVKTEKTDKMSGDISLSNALELLATVLHKAQSKMTANSTLFVFSSQRYEPEFRQIIKDSGFTYRDTYIWYETNHGAGDLERTHSPQHECIIHAVKGDPKLKGKRPSSVMSGNEFLSYDHPTKKPLDLLRLLIETWTDEGDRIADPFAGSGSVPVAAHQTGRKFWACELSQDYHKFMADTLLEMVRKDE